MADSNKIKLTVLPTETMHADQTRLLINPGQHGHEGLPDLAQISSLLQPSGSSRLVRAG